MPKKQKASDYSLSINDFKNKDGSYSLYDNRRHSPNSTFYEQIISASASKPSLSLKNGTATFGGVELTGITGGWEIGNFSLSPLDFGKVKLAAGVTNGKIDVSAIACAWAPSTKISLLGVNIKVSADICAVGGKVNVGAKNFNVGAAFGWGIELAIDW